MYIIECGLKRPPGGATYVWRQSSIGAVFEELLDDSHFVLHHGHVQRRVAVLQHRKAQCFIYFIDLLILIFYSLIILVHSVVSFTLHNREIQCTNNLFIYLLYLFY